MAFNDVAIVIIGFMAFVALIISLSYTEPAEDYYMSGIATLSQNITATGVWHNITFNNTLGYIYGFIFTDNTTIEVLHNGYYLIKFGVGLIDVSPAPDGHAAFRITKNGEELEGSYYEKSTTKQNSVQWGEHGTYAYLKKGDKLTMQYIADTKFISIRQLNTFATQPMSAYGVIMRTSID